ncbi:M1 family metallopeptidase [bacterium]|nr:M1 family metallopeptidase [bacterium]
MSYYTRRLPKVIKTFFPRRAAGLLLLLLFCSSSVAQETPYDRVSDQYPKNRNIDVLNYAFDIKLADQSDMIEMVATIDVLFVGPGQHQLRLDLVKTSDELDGKGMIIDSITMDGASLAFQHQGDELLIDLGREMPKSERIQVSVTYHGRPALGLIIGPTKYGDHSYFSKNWSSRARNWLATVDHPYDKATSEFIVTAPEKYQVVSNGLMIEETNLGDGNRRTHWKNSVPIAPWLYALGVAEFAVQHVGTFDGKDIQTWVYRQDRDAGFYDFAVPTKKTLAFYTDLVGPYSYEKLANVQATSVQGGMEAASSIFYNEKAVVGTRPRGWQNVIVHEIAHQWFGNAVTESEWNHVWLSEGFATYYTLLYRDYAYGREDFVNGLKASRAQVIKYYMEEDPDYQVIPDHLEDLNKVSTLMTYQKGAWTLHMLRELMGVEAYNKGVRTYYAEFQDKTALTGDFRRHMEAASGMDLRSFLGQWLYQGGVPELTGSWSHKDGQLHIELIQTAAKYWFELDVELDVQLENGEIKRINMHLLPREGSILSVPIEGTVVDVIVDPETVLLARWNFIQKK